MSWEKVQSTIYPSETDTTSSQIYNYMRRNIVAIAQEQFDKKVRYYVYDECKVLKEDWDMFMAIMAVTPYTATQTAYYGEKEKNFYNVPQGILTVYFDNYTGSYSVDRIDDRLTVSFDTLENDTNITIIVQ